MNFHGIIIYEIIEDERTLKGIYTNTGLSNKCQMLTEIVKKKTQHENGVVGTYSCRLLEDGDKAYIGELEIQLQDEVYEFLWKVENDNKQLVERFKGIGLKAGSNHLAVSYWYL